jgi:hypothetical protein
MTLTYAGIKSIRCAGDRAQRVGRLPCMSVGGLLVWGD